MSDNSTTATVVFVHGAFAESNSWNGVIDRLLADGQVVISLANPLRSVAADAAYLNALVASIPGPVVLVGHSYGGMVISGVTAPNAAALVYVAAFAPEVGESALDLSNRFPGSSLGDTLTPPVALPDGNQEIYIQTDKFHNQFAADVPADEAARMAATQRPVTTAALSEVASGTAWKRLPSWFVYGEQDKNIPPASHAFMAGRAGAQATTVVPGASHVVMISHPDAVAELVFQAIAAVTPARTAAAAD
jgi:pimeloyl-ACP methyl ester carboxylesterase